MRPIVCLLLIFVLPTFAVGQSKTDSLLKILPEKAGSERIKLLLDISTAFRTFDPDSALHFAIMALSTAEEFRDLELIDHAYIQLAKIYNQKDQYDSAIYFMDESYKIEIKLGKQNPAAFKLASIGDIYLRSFNYEKAIQYLSRAVDLSRETGNKNYEAMFLMYLGSCYNKTADYDNAIKHLTRALQIHEELGNEKMAGENYNQIGSLYKLIGNLNKAHEYFQKSLEIRKKINYPMGIAGSYNNIGLIHASNNEFEKALENYYLALEINKEHGFDDYTAANLNNIASVYKDKQEYTKALDFFQQALDLNLQIGNDGSLPLNYKNIGFVHHKLGNDQRALDCYLKGIEYAKKIGQKKDLRDLYKELSLLYKSTGNYQQALQTYELYEAVKDSIMNTDKIATIAEIETKYETDKKNRENQQLRKESDNKKRIQLILIIAGILFFVIAILLFILFRMKSRSLKKSRQIAEKEKLLRETQDKARNKEKQRLEELVFAEHKVNELQEQKLSILNQQMSLAAMQILNKTELLNEIKKGIEQQDFEKVSHTKAYQKLIDLIENNRSFDHDWDQFKKHFEKVHKNFFRKLRLEYPQLTPNDLKICAYLRIGLSTKEIARMLHVTEAAVSKSRQRLKKKLELGMSDDLSEFISKI